jgi:hypothetical protein
MTGDPETDALLAAFEACTLDKARWTHASHVTAALAYVRAYGQEEALRRIRDGIRRYNAAVGGSPTAYHETITRAWIAVVAQFAAEQDAALPFAEQLRALLARCGDKDYLLRFYSRDLLLSNLARAEWVPPDLARLVRLA